MRDDYGERYRELYERHWWWRAREDYILRVLAANQPSEGWKQILDVGCGDGLFFDRLAQFGEVQGVEPAVDLISKQGPHFARIHRGPFDDSFQPGKKFSLVLMLDVLEHLDDPVGALRQALSLLAPNGVVMVTVPAFETLWTNHDVLNQHRTRYTKSSFRAVARQAGMKIESERYFFHWLAGLKLATRLAESVLPLEPKPPKIPPAPVNQLLYWISRAEMSVLGLIGLPFGSSLMVLGRKAKAAG